MILDPPAPENWPSDGPTSSQTAYEAEALAFCRSWLSGQTTFTLHTSGSTGTPKPISLTRAQMQASAHLTGQMLGLLPGDAALVCLNIRYVAGVMMLVRGLELGLPMTILEPTSNPLADFGPMGPGSLQAPFVFTALVPLQLQTILKETPEKIPILNGMKAILVGGAATSPALEQALQVITAPVYATYGMTETVSHIALRRLNGPLASDLFTALPSVELGTDDRDCLHITSAATNFERIQTNDVVELVDSDAGSPMQFRLLGRADRIINSGGVKVQPERVEQLIETVLARFGTVPRLFVGSLPDARLGQRIVLVSEGKPIADAPWATVQEEIRTQLGPYAVPKEQITIPQFAETATGKIDRTATLTGYTG